MRKQITITLALALVFALASVSLAGNKTVGIIMTGDIQYYQDIHNSFTEGIASEKAELVIQTPNPEPVAWANAAKKLVVLGAKVIVAYGAPATLTVMKSTSEVPIVFVAVYGAEEMGIAGKNATGVSATIPLDSLVEDLKAIKPFAKLGVIFNKTEKDTILQAKEIKSFEGKHGFQTVLFNIASKDEVPSIKDVDALLMTASCSSMQCIGDIIGTAHTLKIPTASTIGGGENRGVLLTVTPNPAEQGAEAAKIVKQILGGADPASIKVVAPKKVDIIVNLKEAADGGFTVPGGVTSKATKVIK